MKTSLVWLGVLSGVAAWMLAHSRANRLPVPVSDLAHQLESAWADHHTVV